MNFTCSVTVCFGFNVTGKLLPETVKPVPAIDAEFTVTEEVPVEVSVTFCVAGLPIVTEPKLILAGETVRMRLDAVAPVPVKPTTTVGLLLDVLLMVNLPVEVPATVGLNFTFSVTACFGLKVTGKLLPETVKPVPEIVAEFTVTEELPVEVRVTFRVPGQPIVTEVKVTLNGETVRTRPDAAAPIPVKSMDIVGLLAELLFTLRCPVAAPAVAGLNCTSSGNCWPGFSVTGKVPPETVKPDPLIVTDFTVTGALPVDVGVRLFVVEFPGVTGPKATELESTDSFETGRAVPVPPSVTIEIGLPDEVLFTESCPVAGPIFIGLNCTSSVSC